MNETAQRGLLMSDSACRKGRLMEKLGRSILLLITSLSVFAVLFIFIYIAKDAFPFIKEMGLSRFFGSAQWYPSMEPPSFGAMAIVYGTLMVTVGAIIVAVPLGVAAAICLSDVLPFEVRQVVKPIIEMLAAIPSVAFGFFALVVFAPVLQNHGGALLSTILWVIGLPLGVLLVMVLSEMTASRVQEVKRPSVRLMGHIIFGVALFYLLWRGGACLWNVHIASGTNALNVSFILGMMALPTIVSVAEDSLQAVGRDLREGSYALGATRAETMVRVILPAASSGIASAIILGIMRAFGETMVVWMASGNTARIPSPWYNFLAPVRTLTASIAGDMGEAARGTMRYHVLFVMAFFLLVVSFIMNMLSQWAVDRQRKRWGK